MRDDVIDFVVQQARAAFSVARIVWFGSRAQQTHRPNSDYDIAFEFLPPVPSGIAWAAFVARVSDDAPTLNSLDLVNLNEPLQDPLRADIEKTGIWVYTDQHVSKS